MVSDVITSIDVRPLYPYTGFHLRPFTQGITSAKVQWRQKSRGSKLPKVGSLRPEKMYCVRTWGPGERHVLASNSGTHPSRAVASLSGEPVARNSPRLRRLSEKESRAYPLGSIWPTVGPVYFLWAPSRYGLRTWSWWPRMLGYLVSISCYFPHTHTGLLLSSSSLWHLCDGVQVP